MQCLVTAPLVAVPEHKLGSSRRPLWFLEGPLLAHGECMEWTHVLNQQSVRPPPLATGYVPVTYAPPVSPCAVAGFSLQVLKRCLSSASGLEKGDPQKSQHTAPVLR